MGCLCSEIAGPDIELASICLGELWLFDNLSESDLTELIKAAARKKRKKVTSCLCSRIRRMSFF